MLLPPAARVGALLLGLLAALQAAAQEDAPALEQHPAVMELNWTPLRMPTGERSALLGGSYLVALNEDWGLGPSVYGAAQGRFGGLFTAGFTLQRRWRLAPAWQGAASFYAGAGGGVSSEQVRAGGGLMLRSELSVHREFGSWSLGAGLARVRFPSGNIGDTQWTLNLARSDRFSSFSPAADGRAAPTRRATGMGFDEIALHLSSETPLAGSRGRGGQPQQARLGKAGAELRRYLAPGSWWGLETAGASSGPYDGYMEILAQAGRDWPLFSDKLRLGAQIAIGLAGGGDVDSGSGWLLRAGPSLRWITPWGGSLRLEAALTRAPDGRFRSRQWRLALAMPLAPAADQGRVRAQSWSLSLPHYARFRFKDGSEEAVTGLGIAMTRSLRGPWYGTAQAGSAAFGKAGAFSYGLAGLGAQSSPSAGGWRVGGELLAGAAGGGGVVVGGGAVAQGELWAQWEPRGAHDRLRLRAGLGHWRSLGGRVRSSTPLASLSLGWAFGTLGP